MTGIYQILNEINEHRYVGSAVNIKNRWNMHRKTLKKQIHHNRILQRAWNKYGESSFKFLMIEEVSDISKLIEKEQNYLDSLKPEYNICPVAGSSLGAKYSEESKQKMRKPKSTEHRQKLSASKMGFKHSEETKLKMRNSRLKYLSSTKETI